MRSPFLIALSASLTHLREAPCSLSASCSKQMYGLASLSREAITAMGYACDARKKQAELLLCLLFYCTEVRFSC